ncbi:MAG TPA: ATP-grasp domain-containing protein [Nitrososphaerales archaeon]|nr:ATP-grasp domain-containing protein [Nitrososphaerales archaeon]
MKEAVIITAAGSIIGEGVIKCLKFANTSNQKSSYEIVAADMSAEAAGLYRGDYGEILPPPDAPNYFEAITGICKKYSVRAIFVGSDEELLPLAKLASKIERETGSKVITNPVPALEIGMDKWKTYELLKSKGLPCAESSLSENKIDFIRDHGYPVVVKPRVSHGSENLFVARSEKELEYSLSLIRVRRGEPIIQEYLEEDDAEYTTGVVLSEQHAAVISSIAIRRKLKHGQTYKAFVEDAEWIRRSSEAVALALGGNGPVNIQSRFSDGKSKVFEINPRFSASCPIRAVAGVNEPDIVFRDQILHEDVSVPEYKKLVALRFWNEVYVPQETFEAALKSGSVNGDRSFVPDYF